jgi:hypothetical protein
MSILLAGCSSYREFKKIAEYSKDTLTQESDSETAGKLQPANKSLSKTSDNKRTPVTYSGDFSNSEQVFKDYMAKQKQQRAEWAKKRADKIQKMKEKERAKKLLAKQIKSKKGNAYKYLNFGESLNSIEKKLQIINQKFKIQKSTGEYSISMLDNGKAVTLSILPKTGLYLYSVIFSAGRDMETAIIKKYSGKYGKPNANENSIDGTYRLSPLIPSKIPNCRFRTIREKLLWESQAEAVTMLKPRVKKIISIIDNSLDKNYKYPTGMKDKLIQVANQLKKDFPNNTEIPRKALQGLFEAGMLCPVYGDEPSLEMKKLATIDSRLQEQLFKNCIGENVIILAIISQKLKSKAKEEIVAIAKTKANIAIAKAEAEKKAKEKAINDHLNF